MLVYNNTTSKVGTHFLAGVQLIKHFTDENKIPNENWAYPLYHFGDPEDDYYMEIWCNGMDYSVNLFIIERIKHNIHVDLLSVSTYKNSFPKDEAEQIFQYIAHYRKYNLLKMYDEYYDIKYYDVAIFLLQISDDFYKNKGLYQNYKIHTGYELVNEDIMNKFNLKEMMFEKYNGEDIFFYINTQLIDYDKHKKYAIWNKK